MKRTAEVEKNTLAWYFMAIRLAYCGPTSLLILSQVNRSVSAAQFQQWATAVQFTAQAVIVFIFIGKSRKIGPNAAIAGAGIEVC